MQEQQNVQNTHKPCGSVKCDVGNCVYNDKNNICMASKIEVGPHYAASSRDTVCSTFKQK